MKEFCILYLHLCNKLADPGFLEGSCQGLYGVRDFEDDEMFSLNYVVILVVLGHDDKSV